MRHSAGLFLAVVAIVAAGCDSSSDDKGRTSFAFAVLSDVHLHDSATLGASGPEFEAYLAADRNKMIAESEEILDAALADLKVTPLDFMLISGDLTKDGERVNHELLSSKLVALEAAKPGLHV